MLIKKFEWKTIAFTIVVAYTVVLGISLGAHPPRSTNRWEVDAAVTVTVVMWVWPQQAVEAELEQCLLPRLLLITFAERFSVS